MVEKQSKLILMQYAQEWFNSIRTNWNLICIAAYVLYHSCMQSSLVSSNVPCKSGFIHKGHVYIRDSHVNIRDSHVYIRDTY